MYRQLSEDFFERYRNLLINNNMDFGRNDVLTTENMNEIINNVKGKCIKTSFPRNFCQM
jgi:hypothetical protein